jgi:hypothetical protein
LMPLGQCMTMPALLPPSHVTIGLVEANARRPKVKWPTNADLILGHLIALAEV